ncbi:MAG: hypothetical protein ISP52_06630 [Flavobacteriaceae bacterium]|nr:hypothetical protein [Flavobacteriaceae bacterium]
MRLFSLYKSKGFQSQSKNKSKRKQLYFYTVNVKRSFLGFWSALTLFSCLDTPSISWVMLNKTAQEQNICQGRACPDLTISFPKFESRDSVALTRLNKTRDSLIMDALYLGSDRPNFGLSIEEGIDQYLWVGLDYKTELLAAESYGGQINITPIKQGDTVLTIELTGQLILPQGKKLLNRKKHLRLGVK